MKLTRTRLSTLFLPTIVSVVAGCHAIDTPKVEANNIASAAALKNENQSTRCNTLFAARQQNALKLTLRELDQDPKGGWRVFENEKCFSEAATLISFYIDGTKSMHSQLWFHAGQLLASAGEYPAAVREFK